MKIEKGVLQELLQILGKVVRPESVIEEYKSVWFVGIPGSFQVEVVATDGEQYVSVTVEATDDKEINFALPFVELEQRVADCQGDTLEIEGRYLVLPEMPCPPADAVTTELPEKIGDLLTRALPFVDCKAEREILRGINFSASGIVAANKEMLLHFPCPLTLKQNVTLPVPPFTLPAEEKGSLHIWNERFQMQIGNLKWQGKIIEGEFPDWRNIVCENKPFETTIKFNQSEELINWMKNIPAQEKEDWLAFNCLSYASLELTAYRQDDIKLSLAPRIEGSLPRMVFSVDRNVLLKTLQSGYTTLKLRDPLNPITFSGANGYCVVMPVRCPDLFRASSQRRKWGCVCITATILLLLLTGLLLG